MSTLSNLLSSAVEKLLFHPVTITHAETIDGHFRRVRLQGEVFRGVKWVPGQAVQFYLGNLTKRAYTPMEMEADAGSAEFLFYIHGGGPGSAWAESLKKGLTGLVQGKKVLLARATIARDVIPVSLQQAGAEVDVVDAYRNVLPVQAPELLRQGLARGVHAATFTSSSSVTHLAEAARAAHIKFPFAKVAAISIGPITSKTLRSLGWVPACEATVSDVPGLVDAVMRALGPRN